MNDAEAYLVDGVRTPFGRFRGALAGQTAVELGAAAITELVRRQPGVCQVDAAMMGVVLQANLGQNPARVAAVRAGIPLQVPGTTLNNVCLASLDAVCDATRRIRAGEGQSYLVGGFDSMSNAVSLDDGLRCTLSHLTMGELSDHTNMRLGIGRDEQDAWAACSHQRAHGYAESAAEVFPLKGGDSALRTDECVRSEATRDGLARLNPVFLPAGTITAGNSSQISDGAAVGLIADGAVAKRAGGDPYARIVDWALLGGSDPSLHLRPAEAIDAVLRRNGLADSAIDLYEINEAFAGVVIASIAHLGIAAEKVNVRGGAVALGHPFGATGFRLLLTLAAELRRRNLRRGIAALCGGGGQGLAVLIERPWCSDTTTSTPASIVSTGSAYEA